MKSQGQVTSFLKTTSDSDPHNRDCEWIKRVSNLFGHLYSETYFRQILQILNFVINEDGKLCLKIENLSGRNDNFNSPDRLFDFKNVIL